MRRQTRRTPAVAAGALLAAVLHAPAALACPICDSAEGQAVRAGIAEEFTLRHVLGIGAPFAVSLGAVALLARAPSTPPPARPRRGEEPAHAADPT